MARRRYCQRGHDTKVVGRAANGSCRECGRIAQRRYEQTEKGRIVRQRYRQSENGRLTGLIWKGEKSLGELETRYVELSAYRLDAP